MRRHGFLGEIEYGTHTNNFWNDTTVEYPRC